MAQFFIESDYSSDYLRWLQKIEGKKLSRQEDLENLQNEIIKENDSALAYFFAYEFHYKSYRMQKVILDKKNPKYAFMFASRIDNADIEALQNLVIKLGHIKYITYFACFIKKVPNLSLLESLIIKSNNVKFVHMYLKHVKAANVNNFKEIILSSKKPRYLFELAKHSNDMIDIQKIEDLIIASGSFTYIRLLAEKIKSSNLEKLEQAVLDLGNDAEIKKFAKYVKKSKMRKFLIIA